jgi:hypothetical protein
LEWFLIQPKFDHVESDVLLLLDCCFAAQAARARQVPTRVELLAASAMGVQAPPPGKHSFTTILINELKRAMSSPDGISVAKLHSNLMKKESEYKRSPIHVDLGLGTRKSICLIPLEKSSGRYTTGSRGHELTVQIMLRDVITQTSLPSIVQWLRHQAPSIVLRMNVEKIVSHTEKLNQLVFDEHRGSQARSSISLAAVDFAAKQDILQSWTAFATFLVGASQGFEEYSNSELDQHQGSKDMMREKTAFFHALEMRLSALTETIKGHLLASNNLFDQHTMAGIVDSSVTDDLGISDIIKMRVLALFPKIADNVDFEELQTCTGKATSAVAAAITLQNIAPLGPVLIEYKGICDGDTAVSRISDQRVQQLADLLSAQKPEEFRALKCIKSFKPVGLDKYGLAFEIPEGHAAEPTSLIDMIRKSKTSDRPTLAQRFGIAFKICQAVANWHRVGWVLQSVASFNVVFFKWVDQERPIKFDFASPYLCGYEYSRPNAGPSLPHVVDDFDRAVYCHPLRHGVPSSSHRKIHDLYSLGVVLLEIGLWRPTADLFPTSKYIRIKPAEIQATLISNAKARLAHYMGQNYVRAVVACLSGDFGVKVDDPTETQLSLAFNRIVTAAISQGVGLD